MKNIALFIAFTLFLFGFGGNVFSYEGGTKLVATMTHPERGEAKFSPLILIPHEELAPSKPVLRLLHRVPEPTLSKARIREEKWGRSLGTKALVRFQKEGRI